MTEEIEIPTKPATTDETIEERLTENAYESILPARYLKKDSNGELVETQEELFQRVGQNIALAEAVHSDEDIGILKQHIKPTHPNREEVIQEVFGQHHKVELTEDNVVYVSYDRVVEDLPEETQEKVVEKGEEFTEMMEQLKFVPNSPTLMNAGDELQQLSACVGGDSPIYTNNGIKRMQDVEEGDKVLTHKNRFRRVKNIWSNGVKETIQIRRGRSSDKEYDVSITPDHELLDELGNWSRTDEVSRPRLPQLWESDVDFPDALNITNYFDVEKEGMFIEDGRVFAPRNGNKNNSERKFHAGNNSPFNSISNNDDVGWLFGIYLAEGDIDGGNDIRFTLHSEEKEYADKIISIVEDEFGVSGHKTQSNHGNWQTVKIHSKFISALFEEEFGTGSTVKSMPEWIGDAPKSYLESLYTGIVDGDGTRQETYERVTLANPGLVYQTELVARKLGYDCKFRFNRKNQLSAHDTSAANMRYSDNYEYTNIDRKEGEKQEVYDMEVEEDHSFVVGDFIAHNCFTNSPKDDMDDIHQTAKEAALTFQSGGGVGYAFSHLRPYGDVVGSTGGISSGPLSFMRTYDQICSTIAQGGSRRGAQMGIMRVSHPDIIQFIHAKNKDVSLARTLKLNDPDDPTYTSFGEALDEARGLISDDGKVPKHLRNAVEGHLSNFNISVGVTDDFMEAVKNDNDYTFINPRTGNPHISTKETKEMYGWHGLGDYVTVGEELTLPAQIVWDRIIDGAYENGEPGVIYMDTVNDDHAFPVSSTPQKTSKYQIVATNPCSEQPLIEGEACNLGHINLSTVASKNRKLYDEFDGDVEEFLDQAINWEDFNHRIEKGTRFLDNVVTMCDFPTDEISERVGNLRKIGLGIMGLAQLYIQLGVEYGSEDGNEIARQLMTHINQESKQASKQLAIERQSFSNWPDSKYAHPERHRDWFKRQTGDDPEDWPGGFPIRNYNTTTIAPTGTTSMVGNTTGGCEPIYNVAYYKNVSDDVQGDEMLVEFDDYFLRVLEANQIDSEAVKKEAERQMSSNSFNGVESLSAVPDTIGELFVTTGDLNAKEHASVQCALQEGVDSAISKTSNAPSNSTKEDADEVFRYIHENGGKSVTYYRDGARSKQVLTTREDNQDMDENTNDTTESVMRGINDVIEGNLATKEDLAKVLKYSDEDVDTIEQIEEECPECGEKSMIPQEGCSLCPSCGFSPCS